MKYEIVHLEEKKVVGISIRANNQSPDVYQKIGELWTRFFTPQFYGSIENKTDGKALGIYTDYESDQNGDYSLITACEVSDTDKMPEGTVARTIPAGKYAKFVVKGELHQAIGQFWQELWAMDLPRAFGADFEEYQNSDSENAEIHVYIGLKA